MLKQYLSSFKGYLVLDRQYLQLDWRYLQLDRRVGSSEVEMAKQNPRSL